MDICSSYLGNRFFVKCYYAFYLQEILLCKVNFRNEPIDRRVILYLNDCDCGRSYCREKAACLVKNQLRKVSLKDTAVDFIVE